jgi:hypothetical protein
MAKKLSAWAGHTRCVVDVLAGCLAVLPDCSVEQLIERLAAAVEEAAQQSSAADREHFASAAYRIETAFNLGWSLLAEGPQRDLLRVLSLAGGGPLPRSLLRQAAGADSANVDQILLSGFCSNEVRDNLSTAPALVEYILTRGLNQKSRESLRFQLLQTFHEALAEPLHDSEPCLDEAWEHCWQLCSVAEEGTLRASLIHRWGSRLRARGQQAHALEIVERHLTEMHEQGEDPSGEPGMAWYLGLLQLDAAILHIESGQVQKGISGLRELLARPAESQDDKGPRTLLYRERAEVILAQAEAFYLRDSAASKSLPELLAQHAHDEAMSLTCIGLEQVRRGLDAQAQERLEQAKSLWENGQPVEGSWVELSIGMGQSQARAKQNESARKHLDVARVASGGDLDRRLLNTLPLSLHELGLLAADEGRLAVAGTYLDEAAMLAASSLPPGHPTRLLIAYHRGLVHLARRDLRKAESQFSRLIAQDALSLKAQQHVILLARCARVLCRCSGSEQQRKLADEELQEVRKELEKWPDEQELHAEVELVSERYLLKV